MQSKRPRRRHDVAVKTATTSAVVDSKLAQADTIQAARAAYQMAYDELIRISRQRDTAEQSLIAAEQNLLSIKRAAFCTRLGFQSLTPNQLLCVVEGQTLVELRWDSIKSAQGKLVPVIATGGLYRTAATLEFDD